MEAQPTRKEQLTLTSLMRLELLLASLLPTTAILLIGVVGTRWVMPAYMGLFVIIFLLCMIAIFFGEYTLISMLQLASKGKFSDLIAVCLDYQAGNKERRAILQGDQDLTTDLAQALNSLLDFVARQQNQPVLQHTTSEQSEGLLKARLKQLASEIAPVMDADLRKKAAIADGDIGVVIDACNYLTEELVQQIKWARRASEQVINATREMVDHSIEFAQTVEMQMVRLSKATETEEKLVAFIQRLSSTLQPCADLAVEMQVYLEQSNNSIIDKLPRYPVIVDSTRRKQSRSLSK